MNRARRLIPLLLLAAALPTACGSSSTSHGPVTITLVAYDSFPTKDSGVNTALTEFTAQSGITVKIVTAGDAGTMVTKAALTAGTPEGDVMWGVDNTLLSAATDGKVFDGQPTEVDHGDVCVNYDIAWFAKHQLQPPASLDDLVKPEYKNLLVVEDASASSTGLAFLLGTIASKGDQWTDYWKALRANGVEVSDSWDTAYYQRFSGAAGSKGDKPLVVSYASSPPAEVVFANPPRTDAPTGVSTDTCFRQIEYAGVLRGTSHTDAAKQLVDFFRSDRFQRELPLSLFVNPVDPKTSLPDAFVKYGVVPTHPFTMEPATIAAHRAAWQEQWHQVVIA
jgi:thiamine transport system substrate-binding protein